jgi:hypothetical protein
MVTAGLTRTIANRAVCLSEDGIVTEEKFKTPVLRD